VFKKEIDNKKGREDNHQEENRTESATIKKPAELKQPRLF
jgi:hypothetical protein